MKKVQLIEIGILAVALICGYKFFESLISSAISILYQFAYSFSDYSWTPIFQYLIFAAIYLGGFIFLVKKRTRIAVYIDKQEQIDNTVSDQDKININLHQGNLLFIILVAMCLLTLITEIPSLLIGIYNSFKKEVSGFSDTPSSNTIQDVNFKAAAIKLVVSTIVLYYARAISNLFNKSLNQDKIVAQTPDIP